MKDQSKVHQELQSRLEHLKQYPAYLPHIGKNYDEAKSKILIVGESHYVDAEHNNAFPADVWYTKYDVVKASGVDHGWFNTREVVGSYLKRHHSGTLGGMYGFFKNLNAVYASFGMANNLFDDGAYMNYYQRPSQTHGKTINVHNLDRQVAFETLKVFYDLIQPSVIVFASKKAHHDFLNYQKRMAAIISADVHQVPHPSSAHWNKSSKAYGLNEEGLPATGKQKFKRILKSILS